MPWRTLTRKHSREKHAWKKSGGNAVTIINSNQNTLCIFLISSSLGVKRTKAT